jgi:hypothetical protein
MIDAVITLFIASIFLVALYAGLSALLQLSSQNLDKTRHIILTRNAQTEKILYNLAQN